MQFIQFYVYASVIIGLLQIVDGIVLLKCDNRKLIILFSIIESLWIAPSIIAISALWKSGFASYVPSSYIIYMSAGYTYGMYLVCAIRSAGAPVSVTNTPHWAKLAGCVFGAYFAIVNLSLLNSGSWLELLKCNS